MSPIEGFFERSGEGAGVHGVSSFTYKTTDFMSWVFLSVERGRRVVAAAPHNAQAGPRRSTYAGEHSPLFLFSICDGTGGGGVHGVSIHNTVVLRRGSSWALSGRGETPTTPKQDHDGLLTRVNTRLSRSPKGFFE